MSSCPEADGFLRAAMNARLSEAMQAFSDGIDRVVVPIVDGLAVAQHPDLAELNVRLDALYEPPEPAR